ncbi:MAG: hypothetical protein ACP5O2_12075 [Bacteroidales bacterium]
MQSKSLREFEFQARIILSLDFHALIVWVYRAIIPTCAMAYYFC